MITVFHRPRKTHKEDKEIFDEEGEVIGVESVDVEEEPTSSFELDENSEEVILKYKTICCERPVTGKFVLNKLLYKGKVIMCAIIQTDERDKQVVYPMHERVDSNSVSRPSAKAYDENFIAKVCFEEDGDVNIFLFHRIDNVKGFTNYKIGSDETSTGRLLEASPIFKDTYESSRKKGRMLQHLDIYNSASYLEAQCDAITRVVRNMVEALELQDKVDSDAWSVLLAADERSVMNIKSVEKCLKEITTHKQNVRKLQKKLYAEK